MILGLTGGLGCGKSTATRFFSERGFRCLDSDALMRDEILVRPDVVAAIRGRFGADCIQRSGAIDRAALARVVFDDDEALRWLEGLTHPLLFERWGDLLRGSPGGDALIEVPLLFEKGLENWFDLIICVTCAPALQLARLEQRGMTREQAGRRISKQLPVGRKIELSDHVLLNDGSPRFLEKQVEALVTKLRRDPPPVRGGAS